MKTLAKYHDPLFGTIAGGLFTIDAAVVSGGWSQPIPGHCVSSTFFDLAGLNIEEKTIFFDGMAVQEGGIPAIAGAAGDNYVLFDIMSSIPIDFTDANNLGQLALRGIGFPGTVSNFEHVLYYRYRRYTLDLDTSARMAMVAQDQQAGSMMPTASDRIYSYRVVIIDAATLGSATSINVQSARHLIQASPREEPTFQHIMRLKRSYDLQQSYDED